MVHRISCSVARGIFPDQGSNLSLFHRQVDYFPIVPPGNSWIVSFIYLFSPWLGVSLRYTQLLLKRTFIWDSLGKVVAEKE